MHNVLSARLHSWGKPWLHDNGFALANAFMSSSKSGVVCFSMLTLYSASKVICMFSAAEC